MTEEKREMDPTAGAPAPAAEEVQTSAAPSGSEVSSEENGAAEPETVESLRAQLDAAVAARDDNLRGWQRAQADFSNYRRRTEQEKEELKKGAEALLIFNLLPVLDDLERALGGLPPELRGLTWVDGVLLIERKLRAVLETHGLSAIEALGQAFDPYQHEAVMRDGDPSDATVVTGELQRGYRLHDRVLRPTMVRVGPPPEGPPPHTEDR